MPQRVTFRKRQPYNTRSNVIRLLKTPGGKIGVQYRTKTARGPRCGDCGGDVAGIPHLRPREYSRLPKRAKHVSRAYGGRSCSKCVRERVVRAFLVEEQKIVKHVMKRQAAQKAKEAPKAEEAAAK